MDSELLISFSILPLDRNSQPRITVQLKADVSDIKAKDKIGMKATRKKQPIKKKKVFNSQLLFFPLWFCSRHGLLDTLGALSKKVQTNKKIHNWSKQVPIPDAEHSPWRGPDTAIFHHPGWFWLLAVGLSCAWQGGGRLTSKPAGWQPDPFRGMWRVVHWPYFSTFLIQNAAKEITAAP